MSILQALHQERLALEKKLKAVHNAIQELGGGAVRAPVKVKRKLSAAGRAKISAAAKKMWAKKKKQG